MPSVWLIEDNAAFQQIATRVFRTQGKIETVRAFECCEDALAAMEAGEYPDVVLMDVGLPGIDGIEGIRRMKEQHADTNIVMLTVYEDDDRIFRAICAGACGYLLKSESMQSVMTAISQAMAGGAPMNPRVARRVIDMFSKQSAPHEDYGLTQKEREVLQAMVEGVPHKQISGMLDMNPHTVDYYIRSIYRKLRVNCVASAVSIAVKEKLVEG